MPIYNEWLVEPYTTLFHNFKTNIKPKFDRLDKGLFTLHDASHCLSVEKMIKAIISRSETEFSTVERFILSCAAWGHDVGMNIDIARDYFSDIKRGLYDKNESIKDRRKEHHNISSWYLQKDPKELFRPIPDLYSDLVSHISNIVRTICVIIKYHRKAEDILLCVDTRTLKGEQINVSLLAAILRLADTLHKDLSRFDPSMYAMLQIASYDRASRLHWLKSFFVSNIQLDAKKHTIIINLDLPDFPSFLELSKGNKNDVLQMETKNWAERLKNLEYIIASDIQEDLLVVNQIFSRYEMPTYVNIKIEKTFVPGFNRSQYDELRGLLSELDILFSPNTSKVIKRTLESLRTFAAKRYDNSNDFETQFDQLLNYLEEIQHFRPCHVSLFRIIEYLKKIKALPARPNDKETRIRRLIEQVEKKRSEAADIISSMAETVIPPQIKFIFLFGFSSTVLNLLSQLTKKRIYHEKISVYIFECATKRRLTHSNQIEYNDGIHYAEELSKLGSFDISIVPDAGFATILAMKKGAQDDPQKIGPTNALVLIGANGIDQETGACGHTSGHLGLVIIAEKFQIPVKVIADSFKIGKINWNLTAPRDSDWLTTQKNLKDKIDENSIKIANFREDCIPSQYISEIVTELGIIPMKIKGGSRNNKELSKVIDSNNQFDKFIMRTPKALQSEEFSS